MDFDFHLAAPAIILAAYGLLAMIMSTTRYSSSFGQGFAALVGLVFAGGTLVWRWQDWLAFGPLETASGMVHVDGFGLFFSFILVAIGILAVLVSMPFLEREGADHGEFYALLMFALAGMVLMVQTTHLMLMLIGLEVFSLALYVVTGLTRRRARSVESALKYFLLGAFSSGFMVYGLALLYGATGSLDMVRIAAVAGSDPTSMLWLGMGLTLIGLAFKIAVVPFHQWVPDVYQGAPTNVTGFMAAATKTAAFAVLLRFLVGAFGEQSALWIPLITTLAILTMSVGNLIALAQTNLKRLLAFSSIAHAGYLLIALACRPEDGVGAILFYLSVYAFMTMGAFAVLTAIGRGDETGERGYTLREIAGLGWQRPWLGVAMTFFLLSLAGIPPTGGFLGKYVIFRAAVQSDQYLLAVVGVLNAAVAAYYYLRVIVAMYMREPEGESEALPLTVATGAVMVIAVAGVMYLGLAPGAILDVVSTLYRSLI